jgi:hypothetical protein
MRFHVRTEDIFRRQSISIAALPWTREGRIMGQSSYLFRLGLRSAKKNTDGNHP